MFQSLCLECFVFLTRPGWRFSSFFLSLWFLVFRCDQCCSCDAMHQFRWQVGKTSCRNITGVFQDVSSIFLKETAPPPTLPFSKTGCIWCYATPAARFTACLPDLVHWQYGLFEQMLSGSFGLSLACCKALFWLIREGAHGFRKPKISQKSLRKQINKRSLRKKWKSS